MGLSDIGGPVTAICLRRAGDTVAARRMVDSIEAGGSLGIYTMGFLASYYAQGGDPARAVEWLDRAYAVSPAAFDFRLLASALFDPIRTSPLFQRGLNVIAAKVRARIAAR